MALVIGRGDVDLVRSEIQKTRACAVVSPDELDDHLRTVIIAPLDGLREMFAA